MSQPTHVFCTLCEQPTPMLGAHLCEKCYSLERAISAQPGLVLPALASRVGGLCSVALSRWTRDDLLCVLLAAFSTHARLVPCEAASLAVDDTARAFGLLAGGAECRTYDPAAGDVVPAVDRDLPDSVLESANPQHLDCTAQRLLVPAYPFLVADVAYLDFPDGGAASVQRFERFWFPRPALLVESAAQAKHWWSLLLGT